MNCKKAETLLVDYLYEELSAQKTLELERHLQSCDQCSATLESWRAIHQGYQKMEDMPAPSPFLKQRIVAAAEEELGRKPSFGMRLFAMLRPAIVIPIVLVALLALWPMRMMKKTEMAETKPMSAPPAVFKKQAEAKAPERPESNATAPKLSREDKEMLHSLGYVTEDKKETDQLRQKDNRREGTRSKAFEDRDEEKQVAQSKLQSAAPTEPAAPQNAPAAPAASEQSVVAGEAANVDTASEDLAKKTKSMSVNLKEDAAKNANYERSQTMFQQNNLSGGKVYAQEAINEDQKDQSQDLAVKYHQSGINYQNQRQFQTAILQYQLVLKNYPAYVQTNDVLQRLADSYVSLGQFEDAKKVYERMLKNSPNDQILQQRVQDLDQRQKAREQLKSLGYTTDQQQ